ncbi:MAG: IS110 family transposase, partial [Lachnospiraceae bacterium]|nr:IS110 family transposase [Lachnospiraceae bacterium]
MASKSLELQHTIDLIEFLSDEIDEIEREIFATLDENPPQMLAIPGMGYRMAAVIVAEIGDFKRFSSPDKILAYAGLSPTTYQSGQLTSTYARMEKRGSKYLRYAIFNATKYVCHWDETFGAYLSKKRAEGKHYNVAISHAAKKLVRLIYHLETSGQAYKPKLA